MSIFLFVLGFLFGLGVKLAIDKYVEWENEQKKTYLDMEQILVNFKAIQKMKELENKK